MAKKKLGKALDRKGAATRPSAKKPNSLLELTQRVKDLEDHVVALKSLTGGGPPLPGMRPLTFTLAAGGPQIVQLLLDGHEKLNLGAGAGPVPSAPRANGVDVSVDMVIFGDPGQRASVDVTNAVPTPMVSAVLTGSHLKEHQDLETSW
jgi:hypothetical protein